MKTLTEFSGTMIRMAAKAEAEARKTIPKQLLRVAPAAVPQEGVTAKPDETASPAAPEGGADSVTDAADQALAQQAAGGSDVAGAAEGRAPKVGEAGTTDDVTQPGAAEAEAREEAAAGQDLAGQASDTALATEGGAKASEVNADEEGAPRGAPEAETSAVKEILDKAVAEATGTGGDRLARLREALRAVGRQSERVRLVRVFGLEEEVSGSQKIGEFQYVVDLMPHSMKQNFEQKDDKKRGPRRPTGIGKQKGGEGSLEGSFSMESVAQDRRSERGPGGGRGGPGGGRGGPGGGRGGPGGGRGGPGGGRGGPGGGRGGPGGGRGGSGGGKPGAAKP
jgi:translation initiation factor IF-2